MCSYHSILECCVMFSGVKLSMGSFVLFFLFLWDSNTGKDLSYISFFISKACLNEILLIQMLN